MSSAHTDAVAYDHQEGWEAPSLTYSGASSPAGSADSSPKSSPATPQSIDTDSPEPTKAQPGHIPRPRNAFIIFRSHFYSKTKSTQKDINQNELSCAAGSVWRALPEEEKATYRRQAEVEKIKHYKRHPNYIYTPATKAVKRAQKAKSVPAKSTRKSGKRHRSSLSQQSVKSSDAVAANSKLRHRSTPRVTSASASASSSSDSDHSSNGSPRFVPLDDIPPLDLSRNRKMVECDKKEDGLLNRIDHQFGCRPEEGHTTALPPMPSDAVENGIIAEHSRQGTNESFSPTLSEEKTSSDPSFYSTCGYPTWMYNELIGGVAPDTGLPNDWNPLQTTLDAYGDNSLDNVSNNDYEDFSEFMNYDNLDTAGAPDGYPFPIYDGTWVGLH